MAAAFALALFIPQTFVLCVPHFSQDAQHAQHAQHAHEQDAVSLTCRVCSCMHVHVCAALLLHASFTLWLGAILPAQQMTAMRSETRRRQPPSQQPQTRRNRRSKRRKSLQRWFFFLLSPLSTPRPHPNTHTRTYTHVHARPHVHTHRQTQP